MTDPKTIAEGKLVIPLLIKRCFSCHVVKSIEEFYPHAKMADGHLNKCKDCTRSDAVDHRNKNIDKIRKKEKEKSRKAKPERVAKRKIQQRKYYQQYPEKTRAAVILSRAVKAKRIEKLPCAFCKAKRVEAHYKDYSKPLDVIWVCRPCHGRFRSMLNGEANQ